MTTITKRITDMSKYGITGDWRWDGSVMITTDSSISNHGKYFPTWEQAEAHVEKLYKEIVGDDEYETREEYER